MEAGLISLIGQIEWLWESIQFFALLLIPMVVIVLFMALATVKKYDTPRNIRPADKSQVTLKDIMRNPYEPPPDS